MDHKKLKGIILGLTILSIVIYGVQIVVFKDPRTTFFYILQDLAFMPLSIAMATFLVGGLLEERDRRERRSKIRILSSAFFMNFGVRLMRRLLTAADPCPELDRMLATNADAAIPEQEQIRKIRGFRIEIRADRDDFQETWEEVRRLVDAHRTDVMVMTSNPILLEHEEFTDLLMGVLHLVDEFRLRGDYETASQADRNHLAEDFTRVLRLLLENWIDNDRFIQKEYPNYHATVRKKVYGE